ncbi:aminomethyl-transferring glycine dehydrogenase subunit GcvPB [Desulfofustis limnaeus]|jgi:glycine dehydrogenase subunit 2|uniref:glycine dehydrogenase (aminomethyl-transferring) n=1 Tax=Desulfofustis limnaeus TaxID=2740163 RepID=A0ABM7WER7_9BACT|nr:aminomethyl-transferring glycine dehydrogenase subunit GcvPB [Desulfofustis limnaeus]MDX9894147.1 aminomethyl-transferring glycine dehydrogenase subunit GcvPB [Desulfofustis sp.]BDD89453.1 putative glycine dehydrogenase (decarboxylating) subunit 2 [Desulfofustis limnaeus]
MINGPGSTGLVLDEPLLWEKGKHGRSAFSLPVPDVPESVVDADLLGDDLDFPDLSEVDVVRHYTRLSQWNFGIDSGMYPLGSCTMKYNPKINDRLAATPALAAAHPLLDATACQGVLELLFDLERFLAAITGMDAVSLQPAAGAQGELTAMLMFAAYFRKKGERRTKILIPDTAHGTNPASAALCGFSPVSLQSGPDGILSPESVAAVMDEQTVGIMLTNPNTLGLFEEHIRTITEVVHQHGGLVYGDGANLNAVMGMVDFKRCGVDAMHLNLHKTFSTPHGGGGPGAGPVCVVAKLEPFLPVPRIMKDDEGFSLETGHPDSIGRMHAFFGNVSVLVRAYSYILTMGPEFLRQASQLAVLNAVYVREQLRDTLELAYDRPSLHECVFSDRRQHQFKVTTLDMAKRLIDHGYHPPTIYFPLVVPGAIMIEPTETECKEDLDRFIAVFKEVVQEAAVDAERLRQAPTRTKVRRLDETRAARNPCLKG